jgi:hypothetical protein
MSATSEASDQRELMSELAPDKVQRYVRSKDGVRIHRAECRHANQCFPWPYADGRSENDLVLDLITYPWLRVCRHCLPDLWLYP